jgi:heme exporter protein D
VSSLVWLAIPLVALVLAVLWVVWTSRTRPRADTHETLEEHARFKAAFDQDRPRRQPPD